MDVVKIKLNEETFNRLVITKALRFNDYEIVSKEPIDYDYSKSEEWQKAKKASDQAFKKLKEIEYNIRTNYHG